MTLVDTGEHTLTGGRLKRVADYIKEEDAFCFTYGDGVANIDISAQLAFHQAHGKLATITAVQPPGRYGALELDDDRVCGFTEKPEGGGGAINGGFFVLSPRIIDFIEGDMSSFESGLLETVASRGELMAFRHNGFWQAMDTLREKNHLETLWQQGRAPWKVW